MGKLYMIRHGKTDWNLKSLVQGSVDIPLNEEGRNEARKVASEIDLSDIDVCIASPLQRASETAKIITKDKLEIMVYQKPLPEKKWIVFKAIKFPYINFFWVGTIVMTVGFCMAIYRRVKDGKREANIES